MSNRKLALGLVAGFCLLSVGCTQESTQGTASVFTYQAWVGIVAILIGAAVTFFGWTQKNENWKGWLTVVVGVLATIGFCPFAFFDKVLIDDTHIETKWGFWIAPTKHNISLDNINNVTLTKTTSTGRRGRRTNHYLNFHLKNGGVEQLTADNTLMEAAADKLVGTLVARNIPIIDQTGGN